MTVFLHDGEKYVRAAGNPAAPLLQENCGKSASFSGVFAGPPGGVKVFFHAGTALSIPVACTVAHREEDRLVISASLFEGLFAPRIPVDLQSTTESHSYAHSIIRSLNKTSVKVKGCLEFARARKLTGFVACC